MFSNNNGSYDFGVVKISATAFPIELLYFKAELEQENTALKWETTVEQNSAFFGIERSLDNGLTFEALANITAAGNSNASKTYQYNDYEISALDVNKIHYRLKMVDIDNSFQYSNTVEIKLSDTKQIYANIYPMPAESDVNIDYQLFGAAWGEIKVMNGLGQVIYTSSLNINNSIDQITLDIRDWDPGAYYVQIYTEEKTLTRKMIKN